MSLENDNNISKILGIHKPMDTVMFPHPSFWLKSTLEQSPKWTSFSAMGFKLIPLFTPANPSEGQVQAAILKTWPEGETAEDVRACMWRQDR